MGNKLQEMKQERSAANPKSTSFKSRFLASPGFKPRMESEGELLDISNQEIQFGKLTKSNLKLVLTKSKDEGSKTYYKLKDEFRQQRKDFWTKARHWGSKYEDLCLELKNNLHRMITTQNKELEKALKETGNSVLENYGLDEKIFEMSILEHASDPLILEMIENLNSFPPKVPPIVYIDQLLEICSFRVNRLEELSRSVRNQPNKQVIVKVLLADETLELYNLEEEEIEWAFKTLKVSEDDPILDEFRQLQERFSKALM